MIDYSGQSLGRYHILEQLGEGGMAVVYKAYDTRLEREAAIKVIRTELFGSAVLARILQRFEREAKTLAKLSHPNIVKLHDYGEHEGSPYLVMEYLPGGTLRDRLKRGPLLWGDAVRLLIPIADALAYAHKHGMVHRDVKSANILLTNTGSPMLTDFGIGKVLESEETITSLTGTGMGVGTPEYMAPEQWTGTAIPQSDQYALGVVLFELITGRKPYEADTPAAILLKQANDPLPRPSKFVKDIPSSLEKVLIKALAKNPTDRYKDMSALGAALEGLVKPPAEFRVKPARAEKPLQTKLSQVMPTRDEAITPRIASLRKPARLAGILAIAIIAITGLVWILRTSFFTSSGVSDGISTNLPFLETSTSTLTATHTLTPTRTSTPTRKPTSTPSITPTPVYVEGKPLFSKDFEDNDIGGWTFVNAMTGGNAKRYWSVVPDNGNLVLHANIPENVDSGFSIGQNTWTNYVLLFSTKIEKLNGGFSATVRASPGKNCGKMYEIGFGSRLNASILLFDGVNCGWGKDNSVISVSEREFSVQKWHDIRIEVYESNIKIYIDGNLTNNVTDSTSLQGSIGFLVGADGSLYLDNIKVFELIAR